MKFQKGNAMGGRTKGSTNKVNQPIREKFLELLEQNLDQAQEDLLSLDARDRLKLIIDIASFVIPKMRAIEVNDVTDDNVRQLEITINQAKDIVQDEINNQ